MVHISIGVKHGEQGGEPLRGDKQRVGREEDDSPPEPFGSRGGPKPQEDCRANGSCGSGGGLGAGGGSKAGDGFAKEVLMAIIEKLLEKLEGKGGGAKPSAPQPPESEGAEGSGRGGPSGGLQMIA